MGSKQLGFYFKQDNCMGCHTCQIACKDKNDLRNGEHIRKIYEINETYWVSMSCNHCVDPNCVKACTEGAIEKREEDGIVLINQDECIGCGKCLKACEYQAIYFDKKEKKAGKCDFCIDYLELGKDPICVAACPLRILKWGELDLIKKI